ncbi:HNH endonuclease [Sphingosinicella sp.]|uniref:HNH endonuclease n=1 Tax=Sphingosinicella sp. TaxID=1917971 RepID=UPI00403834BF
MSEAGEFAPYILGEMAHICGDRPGANRYDPNQTQQQRDDYENLVLLCPTHHRLIDRRENEARYPVKWLHEAKAEHEAFVRVRLNDEPEVNKRAIASQIAPLLAENRQTWLTYGPLSEFARENPHNDAAYAVWRSERLSTIVPNNRRISEILRRHPLVFAPEGQEAVAAFQLHSRSYERWVDDEISYDGVARFPSSFATLVEEALNAGT